MGTTLLSELEQAELASRARLLAATAEADRRIDAARSEAAGIEAGAGKAIDEALGRLHERYRIEGDREVAAIEAELARIEAPVALPGRAQPGLEAAIAAVVAAVLGETGA